jgi:hypothetical protein
VEYYLREMAHVRLIEIDDPYFHRGASDTYYSVPTYVWKRLGRIERDYESMPMPEIEPWLHPRSRWQDERLWGA